MSDKDKAERLAAKLRENLRRRKEQARAARPETSHQAPPAAEVDLSNDSTPANVPAS